MEIDLKKLYSDKLNKWYNILKADIEKAKWQTKKEENQIKEIKEKILEHGFAYEGSIRKDAVLFVGIGCAFNNKNKVDEEKGADESIRDRNVIFLDDYHKERFSYYTEIAKFFGDKKWKIGVKDYATLDLTCIRVTSQKTIEYLLNYSRFKDFFDDNVRLFIEILKLAQPKMVIIGNAYVSDILGNELNLQFNKKCHCWFATKDGFEKIPFFKTTMLSGGHLDNGSKELLKSVVEDNLLMIPLKK